MATLEANFFRPELKKTPLATHRFTCSCSSQPKMALEFVRMIKEIAS